MNESDFFKFMRQHNLKMPPGSYNAKVKDVTIQPGGDVKVAFEVLGGAFDGRHLQMTFRAVEGDDDLLMVDGEEQWEEPK